MNTLSMPRYSALPNSLGNMFTRRLGNVTSMLCVLLAAAFSYAEGTEGPSAETPAAAPSTPAPTSSPAPVEEEASDAVPSSADTEDPTVTMEPEESPLITDPMAIRFEISKIERGIGRDGRRFASPRMVTLTTNDPVAYLDESDWRGKRLGVFHRVPIRTQSGDIAYSEVKVGEIKIRSVYQSTLQAEVFRDDLTRGLAKRKGEARVVMLGDTARLERPIVKPIKPKVRRFRKSKKKKSI